MNLAGKLKKSLQARFTLATVLSVVVFAAILLLLSFAFIQVRSDIKQIASVETQKIVESSRLTRDLGQFLARVKVLQATYYGKDEYLQEEAAYLLKMVQHHEEAHIDILLQTTATSLRKQLTAFLEQATTVNDLIRLLRKTSDNFTEILEDVHRQIEVVKGKASAEAEALRLERLAHLVAHYRIELLEKVSFDGRPDQWRQLSSRQIENLQADLLALPVEQNSINNFVPQLNDLLGRYLVLLPKYHQEISLFDKHSATLNQAAEEALRQIEMVDWQNEQHAEQALKSVDSTIKVSGLLVMGLIVVLALALALIQINLYGKHVKRPLEHIRKRLLALQRGNYSTRMSLERSDEWGQIEAIFNNLLDDLVKSWSALQESETRYRNFFDCAAEGIFQSTMDGVLLNMNPSMIEMFGFADDESEKRSDAIYVDPADRQRMIERLKQEEIVSNYEVEMRRCNGHSFWAVVNSHLVLDAEDNILFIEGTVEDISMRRASEEALRQFKEYLHAIVDTMPSILIGVDENMRVTLWNRKIVELTGVTEEQAFGQPLADMFSLIDKNQYLATIDTTLKSRKIARLTKIPGVHSWEGCFFDLLIYPLLSQEITGAVIHMEDVTEKSRIEDVMVQSEKMLSVGSLAAGMAHEINNPLASVLQNVQVLDQRLSPALKKNQQVAEQLGIRVEQVAEYARLRGFDQMIKSIAEAGQRAARIIENMLNFSRKSSSTFLPRNLPELVEKTIELAGSDYDMKHHFDFRTINVVRDYQAVPDVPCESSQIQQVVLSLLKNAAQALGSAEKPEITVRIFQEDEQVCLQIADNGEGMPEQVRRRIFEPFFTTKEVGLGTGLGLSVSYFLITQNHKGSLTVDSQPGQGTCFSVFLPLARQ